MLWILKVALLTLSTKLRIMVLCLHLLSLHVLSESPTTTRPQSSDQKCSRLMDERASLIPKTIQALLLYHQVAFYHLFYNGNSTIRPFLYISGYKGTVFHVTALNRTPIYKIVEVTEKNHLVAIILDAGERNKQLYKEIQDQEDLILKKLIIAIDRHRNDWNGIPIFGEKLIVINDFSEQDCSLLVEETSSKDQQRVKFDYFSPESESIQNGGYWSQAEGLRLVKPDLWHFDRFKNKSFNVVSLDISILHYYNLDKKGNKVWDGIAIRLLQGLSEALNFTYNIFETPDQKWGGKNPDGTWNGMVGQVKNGYADFAAAALTLNHIRDTVVDYGQPFYMEPAVMVMRRPQEKKLLMFAWPLGSTVWLCMFLSLIAMATSVFFITCLHGNLSFSRKYLPWFCIHFREALTACYGSAMRQSLPHLPNLYSIRLLFSVWWFTVIIMSAAYTGNLTAVLAVPRTPSPIDTLQELADQSAYKYGVIESSALHLLFSSGNNSDVYKRLYDGSIKNPKNLVQSTTEAIQRVKDENYVFMCERTEVIHYAFSDCDLVLGKEEFYPSSYAFVFTENSPYISVFNKRLMQLETAGLLGHWISTQLPRNKCAYQDGSSSSIATLQDLHGGFVILCAGIAASILTLVTEQFVYFIRITRRSPQKAS